MSLEEERAALTEMKRLSDDPVALKRARDRFIERNLRLVVNLTMRFKHSRSYAEIVQEGNMGLMRALELFDPDRGVRFNTYAGWWVKSYVRRYMYECGRLIKIPEGAFKTMQRAQRINERALSERGRPATVLELSEKLGISVDKAHEINDANEMLFKVISLSSPVGSRAQEHFEDWISSRAAAMLNDVVDDIVEKEEARACKARVEGALGRLSEREQKILRERCGFDGRDERTLESLGAELGITRERVRQIQAEALSSMRRFIVRSDRGIIDARSNRP